MLNRDEERRFREIESSLTHEDPRFAKRISASASWGGSAVVPHATAIAVLGCALALFGLLLGSAFGLLGVLLAVVGFSLRFTPPRTARGVRTRGDDDEGESGTGHDGARI